MDVIESIHNEAITKAKAYRNSKAGLLDVIQRVEEHRVFEKKGYPSLFKYATDVLELTEADAYALIGVARKSREVPEIKALIEEGKLHVSNARRIVPVITPENKEQWLDKATKLTQRELEREIVKEKPELLPKPKIRAVTETKRVLTLVISADQEEAFRRALDVLAQKKQRDCTMEEMLEVMTELFLERNDPIRRAKRQLVAGTKARKPGSAAAVEHARNLRDEGQCTFKYPDGRRGEEKRWLDRHHIIPVSRGGPDTLANFATLCRAHHRHLHA